MRKSCTSTNMFRFYYNIMLLWANVCYTITLPYNVDGYGDILELLGRTEGEMERRKAICLLYFVCSVF